MKYEKPVMNMSELKRMGIAETFLRKAYADKNQNFAWKANSKTNSPILFDTEGLERFRIKQIEMDRKYNQKSKVC